MEAPDVKGRALSGFGLGPQGLDLEASEHVGEGLAGGGDVPVDLLGDSVEGHGRVVGQEPNGLAPRPAQGVDAGVHDQPPGAQRIAGEHPEPLPVVLVQAHLAGKALAVQTPSFTEGRQVGVAVDVVDVGVLDGQGHLEVVARYALVVGHRMESGTYSRQSGRRC